MAAVWTPWAWACSDDDESDQRRHEHRRNRQQQQQQRQQQQQQQHQRQPPPFPSVSRPQSAPASAPKRLTATISLQRAAGRPDREDVTTLGDDDVESSPLPSTSFRSTEENVAKSSSTGDLMLRVSGGGGFPTRRALNDHFSAAETREEKREGLDATGGGRRRGQASPSSDFRRLGPSNACSSPLTGCDFNALTWTSSAGAAPSAVASASEKKRNERSYFRPEAVGAKSKCRSSPSKKGKRNRCHRRKKQERQDAAACHSINDAGNVCGTNTAGFSFPARTGSAMFGGKSIISGGGVRLRVFGFDGDDGGGGGDDDLGAGLLFPRGDNSRPAVLLTSESAPSLSTQPPPSSGNSNRRAFTPTMPEEEPMRSNDELEEARLAVSSRSQRRRLCSAFRAHEPASAGMAAAQRAYRGAFVVNKMGDAKARSTWRP